MRKMYLICLLACVTAIFVFGCEAEGTKIYKVEYKENYPVGYFKAVIADSIIFTNGPDILKIKIDSNPDFFCYAVNKEVLCSFKIEVKVDDDAAERYRSTTLKLKEDLLISGKNRTTLPERLVYYINDEILKEEILFVNSIQDKTTGILYLTVSGKGADEKESQKNALKKSDEIVNVLIDKK